MDLIFYYYKYKTTVQITYKKRGNLWFIYSCIIALKFWGEILSEGKDNNEFTKLILPSLTQISFQAFVAEPKLNEDV